MVPWSLLMVSITRSKREEEEPEGGEGGREEGWGWGRRLNTHGIAPWGFSQGMQLALSNDNQRRPFLWWPVSFSACAAIPGRKGEEPGELYPTDQNGGGVRAVAQASWFRMTQECYNMPCQCPATSTEADFLARPLEISTSPLVPRLFLLTCRFERPALGRFPQESVNGRYTDDGAYKTSGAQEGGQKLLLAPNICHNEWVL